MGEAVVGVQVEGAFNGRLRAQGVALKIQRPSAHRVRPGIGRVEQERRLGAGLRLLVQPGKDLHARHRHVHRVIARVGAHGLPVKVNRLE